MCRLFHRASCPCGWTTKAFTRRGAILKREVHALGCFRARHKLQEANVQLLLCRNRQHGCGWYIKFKEKDSDEAEKHRQHHEEKECKFRDQLKLF